MYFTDMCVSVAGCDRLIEALMKQASTVSPSLSILHQPCGRYKFRDYVSALRGFDRELDERFDDPRKSVLARYLAPDDDERGENEEPHGVPLAVVGVSPRVVR